MIELDRLQTCMDALRVLARQPRLEVNRLVLAEQRIKEYLQGEPHVTLKLEQLSTTIANELNVSRGVARAYEAGIPARFHFRIRSP